MTKEKTYYRVTEDLGRAPLSDYMLHGYLSKWDFYQALRRLSLLWKGRIGEVIGERHGFFLLRFHDTPGGRPDEEWLPDYLLRPAEEPEYLRQEDVQDETMAEVDKAFGFD